MRPLKRFFFLTPTFNPVGGVIKIYDYALYAKKLGYNVVICCDEIFDGDLPLLQIERYKKLVPEEGVEYKRLDKFWVAREDMLYFSWPAHYKTIEKRLEPRGHLERVIHIIQNVRHANPYFENGYAVRLLTRPMARIATNQIVYDAIDPYLNKTSKMAVIDLGWDTAFFQKNRTGGFHRPVRVAYTTWKSDVGDSVSSMLKTGRRRFRFKAIRKTASWKELRTLYHWADVFLCTPSPEEGFYLPGLEAMASGTIVISSDAGGNKIYCDFGENCLYADFDDAASYVSALEDVATWDVSQIEAMRAKGYETINKFTLEKEEEKFIEFLNQLRKIIEEES